MSWVFDTSSLSELKHFYPEVFKTLWKELDGLVTAGKVFSTREVWNEMQRGTPNPNVNRWIKQHKKKLFLTPTPEEQTFVAQIFQVRHFQALINEKNLKLGHPVADPFVIACARHHRASVVTQEGKPENAAKIPNVCEHFSIPCMNLLGFMQSQGWTF